MATASKIEWTDCTWNPVIGCRHVAEGCRHCYAETMSKRLAAMGQKDYAGILTPEGKFNGKAITRPETLAEPLHWKKPRMVFVNSMSDLFHEDVPFEFVAAVFGVMAACPQHTFQVLTKRPERALEFLEWASENIGEPDYYARFFDGTGEAQQAFVDGRLEPTSDWPLKNVWLGVSIATQPDADKNVPIILKCPAAVRFVSAEPLIEAVSLSRALPCETCGGDGWMGDQHGRKWACEDCGGHEDAAGHGIGRGLDWVIVGGESGPGARPCDIAWIRSIIEQCKAAGTACFVKQLGANPIKGGEFSKGPLLLRSTKGGDPAEWPDDLRIRQFPQTSNYRRS